MEIKCEYTELIDLHKLVPHPKNPNDHPEEQIERLAKIIDYQGMRSPIVVSKLSGFITKGHGRLAALKKLGWEKAPIDFQEYENSAQEYADIVADNAIAEWALLNFQKINTDFTELGPEVDIELLGIKDFTVEPWESDIEEIDKAKENLDGVAGQIKVKCKPEDKEELVFYLRDRINEASFVGVQIE